MFARFPPKLSINDEKRELFAVNRGQFRANGHEFSIPSILNGKVLCAREIGDLGFPPKFPLDRPFEPDSALCNRNH
jgi:hypothetical protein